MVGKTVGLKKKKSPGSGYMLREMPVERPESGKAARTWEGIKINPACLTQNKQEKEAGSRG